MGAHVGKLISEQYTYVYISSYDFSPHVKLSTSQFAIHTFRISNFSVWAKAWLVGFHFHVTNAVLRVTKPLMGVGRPGWLVASDMQAQRGSSVSDTMDVKFLDGAALEFSMFGVAFWQCVGCVICPGCSQGL